MTNDDAMPYDPDQRRDTPLARKLADRIRREGPITVAEYMHACLQDPEHGYYRTKAAIGAKGDFVTAPEISQCFGELIGLWCAVVWQQMGSPARFNLVELGPGRGTLMADALRAGRLVPGFIDAAQVVLVESNVTLRDIQRRTLAPALEALEPQWLDGLRDLPSGVPTILIANEFLDALPVSQFVFADGAWRERMVRLDARDRLVFDDAGRTDTRFDPVELGGGSGREGDVIERSADVADIATSLLPGFCETGAFAALFIDYGHPLPAVGDTLQAIAAHRPVHPLYAPGEMDLTAHVSFGWLAPLSERCATEGPVPQANFLGALGIMQRAARLMAANPSKAHEIEAGVARLMAVPGMGDRFKVVGIRSADVPRLPGF